MCEKPRNCIGNQTACSAAWLMQPFDYAIENSLDAFEWFPDKKSSGAGWDELDLVESARAQIQQRARLHNVRLSVHARWQANTLRAESWPLFTGPAGQNGTGVAGLMQRLQQRQNSGSFILEQWPHPVSLLNKARDRLIEAIHAP